MQKNGVTATRWIPETATERQIVLLELNSILSSHHFRNSKRYPALLKYVVDETLQGHAQELKERTLGVEVFERQPDYDTNADPVVRYSAGEIRKRIAQYYYENGEEGELQIGLPLGSYVPEFKLRSHRASANGSAAAEPGYTPELVNPTEPRTALRTISSVVTLPRPVHSVRRSYALALAAAVLILLGVAAYSIRRIPSTPVADVLWAPLIQSTSPVLIVMGSGHPEGTLPDPAKISLRDQMQGPYHNISISSAIALSRLAVVLERNGKATEIKESSATSLADLRSRSIVLVGGLNNGWTLRLLQPLRFHFDWNIIRDSKDLAKADWSLDFAKPVAVVSSDYAIVARYYDATTNGNVLVIAGIGPYGTEAASEFVSSPRHLEQLARSVPHGWEKKNLEIVLKTEVINGEAGPPSIVGSAVW